MRLLRRSCSVLVVALLLAALLPVVPASARPFRASHPARATLLQKAAARALAVDDSFPGAAIPASPIVGSLDEVSNGVDIFRIDLNAGQTLVLDLQGPAGTDFIADLLNAPSLSDDAWVSESWGTNEDGTGYPQNITYTAGTTGTYYLVLWTNSGSGAYSASYHVDDPPVTMKRLAGANRFETGLAVSGEWADGSSPTVILATGANFADALAASALAGSYDCPILLTNSPVISAGIIDEIDRLRGSSDAKVFIVGSTKAVSQGIEDALVAHGNVSVTRLKGDTRYETAVAIGAEVKRHETVDLGHSWSGDAWVVRGDNFPDALAAAPIAAHRKMPILLVLPASIPGATSEAITGLGITRAYVTGSNLAINDYVASHLGVPYTRIAGAAGSGRYGTAESIAQYAVDNGWASAATVGIATGSNFPDALGGGALIGKEGGVLVLVNPADYDPNLGPPSGVPAWMDFVWTNSTAVTGMRVFGSNKAVSDWLFSDFLFALNPS